MLDRFPDIRSFPGLEWSLPYYWLTHSFRELYCYVVEDVAVEESVELYCYDMI